MRGFPDFLTDSLRERRDQVVRHPDRNPDCKRSKLTPWLSGVGVKDKEVSTVDRSFVAILHQHAIALLTASLLLLYPVNRGTANAAYFNADVIFPGGKVPHSGRDTHSRRDRGGLSPQRGRRCGFHRFPECRERLLGYLSQRAQRALRL
jgi:hypothetical protein